MQIKVIGKTILAIKNVNTNKVSLIEYRTYDMALAAIETYCLPEGLEFYLCEKTERGPTRKKWKTWLKPK